jgi:hypothetical protein
MKQRLIYFILLFSVLFITLNLTSCKDEDSPVGPTGGEYTGAYGTVTGKFTSPNGDGIPGVIVSVVSDYTNLTTVISDSLGNFVHTKVPTGSVTLEGKKGNFTAVLNAVVTDGGTVSVGSKVLQPKNKMAVVLGSFDSIEEIINDLGYPIDTLEVEDLNNPEKLNINKYSALFVNCGSYEPDTLDNVLKFVRDGGLMYASDWAQSYVQTMFPGKFSVSYSGDSQEVTATIIDPVLKKNLGKETIHIVYDLGAWGEITEVDLTKFTEIVRGSYNSYEGVKENRPLAVYCKEGAGVVVATTFHNEANATEDMVQILEEFIFF